jgi:hypothetical protein
MVAFDEQDWGKTNSNRGRAYTYNGPADMVAESSKPSVNGYYITINTSKQRPDYGSNWLTTGQKRK